MRPQTNSSKKTISSKLPVPRFQDGAHGKQKSREESAGSYDLGSVSQGPFTELTPRGAVGLQNGDRRAGDQRRDGLWRIAECSTVPCRLAQARRMPGRFRQVPDKRLQRHPQERSQPACAFSIPRGAKERLRYWGSPPARFAVREEPRRSDGRGTESTRLHCRKLQSGRVSAPV